MNLICYLYYEDAASHICRLIRRLGNLFKFSEVIVVYNQNSIRELGPVEGCGFRLVPYGGDGWEFGAYQAGIDSLNQSSRGGVVIFNDTAGRNYPLFGGDLSRIRSASNAHSGASVPVLCGKYESLGIQFRLRELMFDGWVRSNIFYANEAALDAVSWEFFDPDLFLAPCCFGGDVFVGDSASNELQTYIHDWLGPAAGRAGWLEHAGRHSVPDAVLARKAGSILLEKFLSARIVNSGGRLVDYCDQNELPWVTHLKSKAFYLTRRLRRLSGLA